MSVQFLILLNVVAFSISTIPNLEPNFLNILKYFEVFSIGVFSIEYLARVILSPKKFRYIFSFFGLIDLFSILPFYMTLGLLDLRSLRIFRLMRLFRILKLTRYSNSMTYMLTSLKSIREELLLYLLLSGILIFVSSVGIYYFEHVAQPQHFPSVLHSMWWSVVTLSTVGYGDVYPITFGGRIFASIVIFIGVGLVSVPSGLIASAFISNRKQFNSEK